MTTEIKPQTNVPVVPAWMTKEECIEQYLLGRTWHASSTDARLPGPLTEQYLLENLEWMSAKSLFSGDANECVLEHLSFFLGMLSQEA